MSATFVVLEPLKSGPLSTRVSNTLRAAIFSGQLKPGEPLRELHLARQLRVSQAPIREALVQLERLGLVVRTPNIGTHVTRLSPAEVRERIGLRAILEEHALLEAAPKMTRDAFDTLDTRIAALGDAIARNDYFEEAQADLAFHRFIWEQTGNRTLYQTLDQLAVPLFAFVSILRGATRQTLKDVVQSHEGLVHALRDGTRHTIRAALDQHFEHGFVIPDSLVPDSQIPDSVRGAR
jgi:DNA-binding GntR family transcriptional regulator